MGDDLPGMASLIILHMLLACVARRLDLALSGAMQAQSNLTLPGTSVATRYLKASSFYGRSSTLGPKRIREWES